MGWGLAFVAQELALFAAVGFLVFGLDDLLVDLIWIGRTVWRRAFVYSRWARADASTLAAPLRPGRFAIFIPAWDESNVIGGMLALTLERLRGADCHLFVGCYPNDPATLAIARAFARRDARVRPIVTSRPGPTTKADCLNALYRAMRSEESAAGHRYKGVILHDAEDVVHPCEIRVFDTMIERAGLVQLPVLPLIDPKSRFVAGHYADEFAESHGKELVVREAIGAAMPSAGVACAIRRDLLDRLAPGGDPFDSDSLTEDYEIGLRLAELGERGMFVRLPAMRGRPVIMTREHFPATINTAVHQKSRWMLGIALAGWDRLGWHGGLAERWMRLRDRKSVLAAVFVLAAYAAMLLWGMLAVGVMWGTPDVAQSPLLAALLPINLSLLCWRLLMRFSFVTAAYGVPEGLWSIPRVFVANWIAVLAARAALIAYAKARRSGETRWNKTRHVFPHAVPAE